MTLALRHLHHLATALAITTLCPLAGCSGCGDDPADGDTTIPTPQPSARRPDGAPATPDPLLSLEPMGPPPALFQPPTQPAGPALGDGVLFLSQARGEHCLDTRSSRVNDEQLTPSPLLTGALLRGEGALAQWLAQQQTRAQLDTLAMPDPTALPTLAALIAEEEAHGIFALFLPLRLISEFLLIDAPLYCAPEQDEAVSAFRARCGSRFVSSLERGGVVLLLAPARHLTPAQSRAISSLATRGKITAYDLAWSTLAAPEVKPNPEDEEVQEIEATEGIDAPPDPLHVVLPPVWADAQPALPITWEAWTTLRDALLTRSPDGAPTLGAQTMGYESYENRLHPTRHICDEASAHKECAQETDLDGLLYTATPTAIGSGHDAPWIYRNARRTLSTPTLLSAFDPPPDAKTWAEARALAERVDACMGAGGPVEGVWSACASRAPAGDEAACKSACALPEACTIEAIRLDHERLDQLRQLLPATRLAVPPLRHYIARDDEDTKGPGYKDALCVWTGVRGALLGARESVQVHVPQELDQTRWYVSTRSGQRDETTRLSAEMTCAPRSLLAEHHILLDRMSASLDGERGSRDTIPPGQIARAVALSGVSGRFDGLSSSAQISDARDALELRAPHGALSASAICTPPHNLPKRTLRRAYSLTAPNAHGMAITRTPGGVDGLARLVHGGEGLCMISGLSGNFETAREAVSLRLDDEGWWTLRLSGGCASDSCATVRPVSVEVTCWPFTITSP